MHHLISYLFLYYNFFIFFSFEKMLNCLDFVLSGNSYSSDFRSLHSKLQSYPGLVKNAFSIDLYQPWSFSAFSSVARVWLDDHKSPVSLVVVLQWYQGCALRGANLKMLSVCFVLPTKNCYKSDRQCGKWYISTL